MKALQPAVKESDSHWDVNNRRQSPRVITVEIDRFLDSRGIIPVLTHIEVALLRQALFFGNPTRQF